MTGGYTMKWRSVNPKPFAVRGTTTVLGPDHGTCSLCASRCYNIVELEEQLL